MQAGARRRMAAAGMRPVLVRTPGVGFGLDAWADGLWSRTSPDGTDELAALEGSRGRDVAP